MARRGKTQKMSDALARDWAEIVRGCDLVKARAWIDAHRAAGDALDLGRMLMSAARAGAADILELLVKSGAEVDARPEGEMRATPLMGAAEGRTHRHLVCVERLLALGADPSARDGLGSSVLAHALSEAEHVRDAETLSVIEEIVRALLGGGADAAAPGSIYALLAAVQLESSTILDLLLDAGAPVDGIAQAPAADAAAMKELAERGVEGGPEQHALVPLQTAIAAGRTGSVRRLLERGASATRPMPRPGRTRSLITPLQYAIEANAADIVPLLLEHGADLNAPQGDDKKWTPLMWACFRGSKIETVRLLLELGARVDLVVDGRTALAIADVNERAAIVELLQARGARAPGTLGVILVEPEKAVAILSRLGLSAGAVVANVIAGAAADHAGLKPEDVIVEVAGKPITDAHEVAPLIASFEAFKT
jgi:ankyrin repeat protein